MKHTGKITKIDYITDETIILELSVEEPLNFAAGQFITIRFEHESKLVPRSYSILSPETSQQTIASCIKLVPGGIGSESLRKMSVGEEIEFLGPLGPFVFDEKASTSTNVFIGTGTGIVPLYSMILSHINNFQEQDFVLVFGAKTQQDLYFHNDLLELEEELENFTYIPVLSRENWEGATGYVQKNLPKNLEDSTFYICGQKPMVLETISTLEKQNIAKEHIKFERYS